MIVGIIDGETKYRHTNSKLNRTHVEWVSCVEDWVDDINVYKEVNFDLIGVDSLPGKVFGAMSFFVDDYFKSGGPIDIWMQVKKLLDISIKEGV